MGEDVTVRAMGRCTTRDVAADGVVVVDMDGGDTGST
jgi:hypothetical protein